MLEGKSNAYKKGNVKEIEHPILHPNTKRKRNTPLLITTPCLDRRLSKWICVPISPFDCQVRTSVVHYLDKTNCPIGQF